MHQKFDGSLKSGFPLIERYSYNVFGQPTIRDANGTEITAIAFGNRFMFTGRPLSLFGQRGPNDNQPSRCISTENNVKIVKISA